MEQYLTPIGSDARPVAARLVERFDNLAGVVAARAKAITSALGEWPESVAHVLALRGCLLAIKRDILLRPPLANTADIADYARLRLASEPIEIFYALYFNARSELIWDGEIARGALDRVSVVPVEFARLAYEHSASVVVVAHNHPSGDASPSSNDLNMTRQIANALHAFGLRLHDHLIVTTGVVTSLRAQGFI